MTHFISERGQIMNTASTMRLIITSLACTVLLGLVGCDDGGQLRGLNNGENNDSSADSDVVEDDEFAPMDEEGHGTSEDEQETIEPGFMNGSWRAATGDQDTPAVYLDTFQDKGDANVTGTYLMALGIYERLDGESGNVAEASFTREEFTVTWNPTNDTEELLTLQATKVDENTLEGHVTAKRNIQMNIPVTLTRTTTGD
jgi:hypothetical protein